MMESAIFVTEVSVIDPDSHLPVGVAIYKGANGAMFGVDSAFIVGLSEDDPVNCPFTGDLIMLQGD